MCTLGIVYVVSSMFILKGISGEGSPFDPLDKDNHNKD